MKKTHFLKLIAIVTAVIFLWDTLAYAVPNGNNMFAKAVEVSLSPAISSEGKLLDNNLLSVNLYIPEQYGTIKDTWTAALGGNRTPTLILIEDAHCIPEIQENISKIIKHLVINYNLKKVCLEGASGAVSTSPFKEYPDKSAKLRIMKQYMEEGILNGVEFLSITEGKDILFEIEGIEDEGLYLKNLHIFRKHYSEKTGPALKYLNNINYVLEILKRKYYSPEFLGLANKEKAYGLGELPVVEYVSWLNRQSLKNSIIMKDYKNFCLVVRLISFERKIDFSCVEKERADLIEYLTKNLTAESRAQLLEKALSFRLLQISSYDFYNYLNNYLAQMPLQERENYKNLYRYIRMVKIQKTVDFAKLEDEIEYLTKTLVQILCPYSEAHSIYKIDKFIFLCERLIRLKISNKEIQLYKELQCEIGIEHHDKILNRLINRIKKFRKALSSAKEFYHLAYTRNSALVRNIDRNARESKDPCLAIVVGGFHSNAIQKEIRRLGYSYVVVTPRLTSMPQKDIYLSLMLSSYINIDSPGIKRDTLPLPVATSLTGREVSDGFGRIAESLTGCDDLESVIKRYRNQLSPEDVEKLRILYEYARGNGKSEEFKEIIRQVSESSASPTFREALRVLFPDVPIEGPIISQMAVEQNRDTGLGIEENAEEEIFPPSHTFIEELKKRPRLLHWCLFILFMTISFANVLLGNGPGLFSYLRDIHIFIVVIFSAISILLSLKQSRDSKLSFGVITDRPKDVSLSRRIINHPLFWFLFVSILLLINTFFYEAVTGEGLAAGSINPELWTFLFGKLAPILNPFSSFIRGRVNDTLAIPFVVYALLSVIRLYSKRLHGYIDNSFFKPLLIMICAFTFMYTELQEGMVRRGLFEPDDMWDYRIYIITSAIMLVSFLIQKLYNSIKKKSHVLLKEALQDLGRSTNRTARIFTFFAGFVLFLFFMYFMYSIPFFYRFVALYENIPAIIILLAILPIIFYLRDKIMEYFKSQRVSKVRELFKGASFSSLFYQWTGIQLLLFSGICLLIRYVWFTNAGIQVLPLLILFTIPYLASVLVWYFHKTEEINNGSEDYTGLALLVLKPSVGSASSYGGIIGVIIFLYSINKEFLNATINFPSSFFSRDTIFIVMLVFFFLLMFIQFIVRLKILERRNIKMPVSAQVVLGAKSVPGQGGLPKEVGDSFIGWIKGNCKYREEPQGQGKPKLFIIEDSRDFSSWLFTKGGIRYNARSEEGIIVISFEDEVEEPIKGTSRIYGFREENTFGVIKGLWVTEEIYCSIEHDRENCLRQLFLHETAEMLFQRYMHNYYDAGRLQDERRYYNNFLEDFIKAITGDYGLSSEYAERMRQFLDYKKVKKYFGRSLSAISGDNIAELVESIDTILNGTKVPYYHNVHGDLMRLDPIVLYSDLDWTIFYHFLSTMLETSNVGESTELLPPHQVRKVFEEYPSIYIEDIIREFSYPIDATSIQKADKAISLIEYLRETKILERIDSGLIAQREDRRSSILKDRGRLLNIFGYVLFFSWALTLVLFFISGFSLDLTAANSAYVINSGVTVIFSAILTIYYVYMKYTPGEKRKDLAYSKNELARWFFSHPATLLLLIIGLLILNQYFFNAVALFQGANFTLPSYFPSGWFNISRDANLFQPVLNILSSMQVKMPQVFDVVMKILELSMLRINAFLELPFGLIAYLAVARLLNKNFYHFLKKSWYMPLSIFSFTAILCCVELHFRNPLTWSDLVFRIISALFLFAIFMGGKIKDKIKKEKEIYLPELEEEIDKTPHKGFNLVLFFVGLLAISGVVLEIYNVTLLYNFNVFITQWLPFIVILFGAFLFIYMRPLIIRLYDWLKTQIFVDEKGLQTISSSLFTHYIKYFIMWFFVPSLAIRYTTIGSLLFLCIAVVAGVMTIRRFKENGWTEKQRMQAIISMVGGLVVGVVSFATDLFGLIPSVSGVELGLLLLVIKFVIPTIVTSIAIEKLMLLLSGEGRRRISYNRIVQEGDTKQASKTRKGQLPVPSSVVNELIEWIRKGCLPELREEVFYTIPDNLSFTDWRYEDDGCVYTAEVRRGEIRITAIEKQTRREYIMDIQAFRDANGKIWLLESTYRSIHEDENAKRQLIVHEQIEDIFQNIWAGEGSEKKKFELFRNEVIEKIPMYTDILKRLFTYENVKRYFGGSLSIQDADRIAELMEKIDTVVMGSKSYLLHEQGKLGTIGDLNDLDIYIAISDLDWCIFYNSLRISFGEGQQMPGSTELRKIFEGIKGLDVNLVRQELDDPEKLRHFISTLEQVGLACDDAIDTANIEKTKPVADIALNIAYIIFQQETSDEEFQKLLGKALADKVKDRATQDLIAVLGKQIIRLERERDSGMQIVVDSFSYLLVIELEKELGLQQFELVEMLLKIRISAGLLEYYDLEDLNPTDIGTLGDKITSGDRARGDYRLRRKRIREGDPFYAFLEKNGLDDKYVVTVGDLVYQLVNFRLKQGISGKDLSEFTIRIPGDLADDVYRKIEGIFDRVIRQGIIVKHGDSTFCDISLDGIRDELGDVCAEFDNDLARALAYRFGVPFQRGDFQATLRSIASSCLFGFANDAIYEGADLLLQKSATTDLDLCILDFEACFEIEKVDGSEITIRPRSADIKDSLKRLSQIKKICFVGMDKELIARYGEQIRTILGDIYGLNQLSNVYLDEIFTIDKIAQEAGRRFGLEDYNTAVIIVAQKNQDVIRRCIREKATPFKAVITNQHIPLSYTMGLAILINNLTEEDIEDKLRRYFEFVGIEIEESEFRGIIEEIKKSGFMLFVMPRPKPIVQEMMNRLSCEIVIDLSA